MKTIALATVAVMTAFTAAHAQSLAPAATAATAATASDVDNAASVKAGGYSPGTIGAMNAVVVGLATSPDDVLRQQTSRTPVAEGRSTLVRATATQANGQSPGTVGAAPGN